MTCHFTIYVLFNSISVISELREDDKDCLQKKPFRRVKASWTNNVESTLNQHWTFNQSCFNAMTLYQHILYVDSTSVPAALTLNQCCVSAAEDRMLQMKVQSTLVISTSVISNNRLSRRKNLVLVITQKSKIRF